MRHSSRWQRPCQLRSDQPAFKLGGGVDRPQLRARRLTLRTIAIYLDANILWPMRTFEEVDRLVLSIVAFQLGQDVLVPGIAACEAGATYRRSLKAALDRHESGLRDLRRKFDIAFVGNLEPQPWIPDAMDAWERRLAGFATVIPTERADALEALEREIAGLAPTKARVPQKRGEGARDAAIWLTIVRHHRAADESGSFITTNSDDFATGPALRHELATELDDCAHPLTLYLSVEQFVKTIGEPAYGPTIGLPELRTLAAPMLKDALKHRADVAYAYWDELEPDLKYATDVKSAEPVQIRAQRRYEREAEAVILMDADWKLKVVACFQDAGTETPDKWSSLAGPIEMTARIQLFIPERDGAKDRAQLITGRWSSRSTLFVDESNGIRSFSEISEIDD